MISLLRRGETQAGSILVFFEATAPFGQGYLKVADREAREVARRFRKSIFIPNASPADLLKRAPAVQVLHVAAHALVDIENPWNSAILLSSPLSSLNIQGYSGAAPGDGRPQCLSNARRPAERGRRSHFLPASVSGGGRTQRHRYLAERR